MFLSYASQDAEAAKKICDALRAAGVEVWFDQSELRGGDAWDQMISRQIKECALFLPVISANTQARLEGYFRREWRLAVERMRDMDDEVPFLVPVVVDDTPDAGARVPERFRERQWTRLPGGETPPAFCGRVKKLLGGETKDRGRRTEGSTESGKPKAGSRARSAGARWWWLAFPFFGLSMAAILIFNPPRSSDKPPPAAATVAPVAELSEARKLVAKARVLFVDGDESNPENLSLADDLLKQAQALDANDAEVWAAQAQISRIMSVVGYDPSPARRALMQKQAERAVKLDPDSVEAQIAYAEFLTDVRGASAGDEAIRILRELEKKYPRHHGLLHALGLAYSAAGKQGESIAAFDRANALPGGDARALAQKGAQMIWWGRYAEAEKALAESLAIKSNARAHVYGTMLRLAWRGDLDGAAAAVGSWPAWLQLVPRGAIISSQVWLWRREPDKAIAALSAVPSDWWNDTFFVGPKSVFLALAHEMGDRPDAARAEWENTLRIANRELAKDPTFPEALAYRACALARLGEPAPAEILLRELEQTRSLNSDFWSCASTAALLRIAVGHGAELPKKFKGKARVPQAALRLNPVFDSIRTLPEFQEWLAAAPTPAETRTGESSSAPAVAPDQKSVAVLAFANLSDDKNNEYFSDGISEELLNVLAKVPGLKVSARTSAFYFKGKEVPVPEIAKQLGVAYVVEGSVRKSGDKVRITAQLIKAADGFHVWSDTFTRDLKDIFAVQDEIAGLIAKNLELKMGVTAARPTVDLEAYQEYLAGRASAAKADMAGLQEAVTHFERAVAIEPRFTAGWVQLASAHLQLGRWGGTPTLKAWQAARDAIGHAVDLEPDSPDVLLALGWIKRTADWDWRGAERAFRRALQLRPAHAETLAGTAVLLFNLGKNEESFRLGQQAIQLDPLNPATQIDLSLMYYFSGNWAESEKLARRALRLAPAGASYHCILSWSLIKQERYAEAEAMVALDTDRVERPLTEGLLAIIHGRKDVARAKLVELEEISRRDGNLADLQNGIAWLSVALGDNERAFAAMEKARESRDPSMAWLRNTPYLAPLYADPRWDQLLHQVGVADDQLK